MLIILFANTTYSSDQVPDQNTHQLTDMKTVQLSPIQTSGLPEDKFTFKKSSLVSDVTACTHLSRLTTAGDDINSPDISPDENALQSPIPLLEESAAAMTTEETLRIVDARILDGWSAEATDK